MADKAKATEEAPVKKGSKQMILIGAAALVLVAGAAAGGFLAGAKGSSEAAPSGVAMASEAPAAVSDGAVGPLVNLDAFIVNILDEEGTRYLKASITLEMTNSAAASEIEERLPQIKDSILLLVGNKTYTEISDLQGKLQLRAELIARVNTLLQKGKIKNIFFTDFVVQ
jgi:flagellar FliL protein